MKLVDKYLLQEHLKAVTFCIVAFCTIFVVSDLFGHFSKFLDAATPPGLVVRYYVLLMMPTLEYILPACLLFGTLYTLWQLTRHNELTAMRASGMSLWRVITPFVAVGLTASLVALAVKEWVAPEALMWTEEFNANRFHLVRSDIRRNQPYYSSTGQRQWLIGQFDLKEPHRLFDVEVTQERTDGTRIREYKAGKAEWLDGTWWFYNATVQDYDEKDNPIGRQRRLIAADNTVSEIPSFTEEPSDFTEAAKEWMFLTTREMVNYLRNHPHLSPHVLAQSRFDIHSRLAMPWACFIVTLFAIPAGTKSARQSILGGMLLAVAFFVGFYALMQVGIFLGRRELCTPWLAAWLPNILFLSLGLALSRKLQ
jgi:lipopolysaccharide export system permease protein